MTGAGGRSRFDAAVVAVAAVLVAGCDDGGSGVTPDPVAVVSVAAQRCDRPTTFRGLGVVIAVDRVLTAAHTVDGRLRELSVDGRPAEVVAIDDRLDLALLAAPTNEAPTALAPRHEGPVTLVGNDGPHSVAITNTGRLVVNDVSAKARHERQVHVIDVAVDDGTSGAPLVDDDGVVVGIVLLADRGGGVSYAVTGAEVITFRDRMAGLEPAPRPPC